MYCIYMYTDKTCRPSDKMSHPLSDEAIAHIEKSWALVQEFGLQEAGIVMFKRSV